MSFEEAVEYALSAEELSPAAPRRRSGRRPVRDILTLPGARKKAALVAQGLTNRQIAKELMVSERTVENHVATSYGAALPGAGGSLDDRR